VRNEGLTALAPRLSREQVQQCFGYFLTIHDFPERALALGRLLGNAPAGEGEELLGLALDALEASRHSNAKGLRALAPHLRGGLAERALDTALSIGTRRHRWTVFEPEIESIRMMERLAPSLSVEQLRRAARVVDDAFKDESERPRGLVALNAELLKRGAEPAAGAEVLLRLALGIKEPWNKRSAVMMLLPVLDKAQRLRAIEEVPTFSNFSLNYNQVEEISSSLDAEAARALLGRVGDSQFDADATYVRALLAARLDEPERARTLLEVFERLSKAARLTAFHDESQAVGAYVTLLRHLKGDDYERVFGAALDEPDEGLRAAVLAKLAPGLEGARLRAALDAALALKAPLPRARALPAFLPRAPDGEKLKALILEALREHLSAVQHEPRSQVLELCADRLLFGAPAFTPDTLKAVAGDVVEVCWRWRWQ
jgi:hypothetical protein